MSKTGTREWSEHSLNSHVGCSNGCRYCYARYDAVCRWKRIAATDWPKMVPKRKVIDGNFRKLGGVIMYPTTHDITPAVLDDCMTVLKKVLAEGNRVLVVSKPHIDCVWRMCSELGGYRDKLEFRFSIGSWHNCVLKFWEPDAPDWDMRFVSLMHAHKHGFKTSVSAEPFLDESIEDLYLSVINFVSEGFWTGKLNNLDSRVDFDQIDAGRDNRYVQEVIKCQRNEAITALHKRMKDLPLVRWKDSVRGIVDSRKARC